MTKAQEFTQSFQADAHAAGLTEAEIAAIVSEHGYAGELPHRRDLQAAYAAMDALIASQRGGPAPTERQVDYLLSLGASPAEIMRLTKASASQRIDKLKAGRGSQVSRGSQSPAQARAAGRWLGIDGEIWD